MPNRVIKESICESESLSECSFFAQELYKRLITYADDYGRFNSDTAIMRARLFPREYETITEQDIIDALVELCGVGKISFYQPQVFNQRGKKGVYGVFPNWGDHQRLRESKAKCPEPYDTAINDWYLRRFIPLDMKVEILLRDGFKCQICGKFLTSCRDAERFVKLGSGLFHIDHIVPVANGGRATMENLRLTCPTCNLTRKRKFDFRGFIDESDSSGLRRVAADCGEVRPESESESESESEGVTRTRARFTPPNADQVAAYAQEMGKTIDAQRFVDFYACKGWKVGNSPMKDWKAAVRNWIARDSQPAPARGPKVVTEQRYTQRTYTHDDSEAMAIMGLDPKGGTT